MPSNTAFLESLVVRPLSPDIEICDFECHPQIDWFLRSAAPDFREKRLSSVICWVQQSGKLAGYITTSMSIVDLEDGTQRESMALKLPILVTGTELRRFPALLIGMLGVCKSCEGRGLGTRMVQYAIGQATELSADTGCRFVTVDADLSDRAIAMYSKLNFQRVKRKKEGDRKTVWMFYDLGPT